MRTENLEDAEILRILYSHNPWWTGKPIPSSKIKGFKRRDFYKLKKNVEENNKILALIGARRVGKTTLIYQLISEFISKVPKNHILLVNLDDPYLYISIKNLDRIFNLYATYILKKDLADLEEPIYVFMDEVHSLKGWQLVLKRWYDLGYNIRFIVSGSSSIGILEDTAESLVGRIKHQIVLPIKFLEFLRFKEMDVESTWYWNNRQLREALKDSLKQNNPDIFYEALKNAQNELIPYQGKIQTLLNQYLIKGGYPENVGINDFVKCGENLREYLELTIYKDIMKVSEIRDPHALENLFLIIARESSLTFNRSNTAKILGIKRDTLNSYIKLLKTAYLISESSFYTQSSSKSVRKETKMYVNDIGIRNVSASVFDEQTLIDPIQIGKIVETVLADHVKRLRFNLESTVYPSTYYWNEDYEVDLVIELFQKPVPIEVKYRNSVNSADLKGLEKFENKFKPVLRITVTKNQLEKHGNLLYIPVWLFLIMC